jgi:pseudouridine-5'-phosphate glycosidase
MTEVTLDIREPIANALRDRVPVVALESTLIAHGLPWPDNLDTARAAESAVRDAGGVPATIAVLAGRPTVGLTDAELAEFARAKSVLKASRRDLASAVANGRTAATTVAATMALADRAGICTFATGGIGGAHRITGPDSPALFDISADLVELSRTPVAVVCAGAKSILDIPRTLEILETFGVPVIGYQCDTFPGFYLHSTDSPVSARADTSAEAAKLIAAHWSLGGGGVLLAQAVLVKVALSPEEFDRALAAAEKQAESAGVRGPAVTPYLLARMAELTGGRSLRANRELIVANARLAAEVAREMITFRDAS